ncbi:MAG: hypothetical protein H7330_04140 [Hymenobacteraceae bacterium]|nr:hypothetical protein [Hymenobacteraceae bacterium]
MTLSLLLRRSLTALLLLPFMAHAQADFQPGYVIRAPGDTVRGEIDFWGVGANVQRCRFRRAAGSAVEEFSPDRGRTYVVEGRRYESHLVGPPFGRDGVALNSSPPRPVFLEALAIGALSVYYLEDEESRERFFLSSPSEPLLDLLLIRRVETRDGRQMMLEDRQYQRLLAAAFASCPAVAATAGRVALTRRSLAEAVLRFNACGTPDAVVTVPRAKTAIGLHLTAGRLLRDRLHQGDGSGSGPEDDILGGKVAGNFRLGVLASLLPANGSARRFTVLTGLIYENNRSYVSEKQYLQPGFFARVRTEIALSQVLIPVLGRYILGDHWPVRPYLEVGVGMQVLVRIRQDSQRVLPLNQALAFYNRVGVLHRNSRRTSDLFMAGGGILMGNSTHPIALGVRYEVSGLFHPYGDGFSQRALAGFASVGLLSF